MTGDGTQLMRTKDEQEDAEEDLSGYSCTMQDIGNGLLIMVSCWVFAGLFSKWLLPKILGVSIHQYAYLVVIAVIMNVTGILPADLRKGISKMYKFINEMCIRDRLHDIAGTFWGVLYPVYDLSLIHI